MILHSSRCKTKKFQTFQPNLRQGSVSGIALDMLSSTDRSKKNTTEVGPGVWVGGVGVWVV